MTTRDLTGLALTRSERIVVVALSYLYITPGLFQKAIRLYRYFYLKHQIAEQRRLIADLRARRRRELETYARPSTDTTQP